MADASSPTDDGSRSVVIRSVVIDDDRDPSAPTAPDAEMRYAEMRYAEMSDAEMSDVGVIVSAGSVTVVADDHRTDDAESIPVDLTRWATLAVASLAHLGASGELQLSFVDVDEITDLNREYMGVDGPTDVLSFPLDGASDEPMPDAATPTQPAPNQSMPTVGDPPRLLGDVIICPNIAALAAPTHAGTTDDELALLVVHGVLHVLGYDHAEPADTERMRAEERDLLTRYHWNGPPPAGFHHDHLDDRTEGSDGTTVADVAEDPSDETDERR